MFRFRWKLEGMCWDSSMGLARQRMERLRSLSCYGIKSSAPICPTDYRTEAYLRQPEKASTEAQGDTERREVDHKVFSSPDKSYEQIIESSQVKSPASGTLPTFHAIYEDNGKRETLFLPPTPETWGPERRHGKKLDTRLRKVTRKILRSTFLEAASDRLGRRSKALSRIVKSQDRLLAWSKTLHQHRRRTRYWQESIDRLFQRQLSDLGGKPRGPEIQILPLANKWFQELCGDEDMNKTTERWRRLPYSKKRARWPFIMIRCLTVSAEQSLHFLLATFIKPAPTFEMIMDAMLYLKRARGGEINSSRQLKDQYMQVLSYQRQPTQWFYRIERKHLDLLLEDCPGHEGRDLFKQLRKAEVDLSYHCMLSFMDFFTWAGDIEMALKALNGIDPEKRLRSHEYILSRCTNLLKLDFITDDGGGPNFSILPRILEAGVRLNLILHNKIMKNAMDLGAPGVAWDLYRHLQDHNFPTNARTYLTLIPHALACEDAARLDELLTVVQNRADLFGNAHLIGCIVNVIGVIYRQQARMSPSLAFSNILAVYSRVFSTAPLKHLNMVDQNARSQVPNPIEPELSTLAFVVRAYVAAQRSTAVVYSLLEWIERLRSEGDDLALALTQHRPLYDGFILFFVRNSDTIPTCLQIVQSMLDRNIEPSDITWAILSSGFTRHGHVQAANEVRHLIDGRGLRPNGRSFSSVTGRDPHEGRADSAAVLRNLQEFFKGSSTPAETEFADAGRRSQVAEHKAMGPMDDAPLHDQEGNSAQQRSGPSIVGNPSFRELMRQFAKDQSGSYRARRGLTASQTNQEQKLDYEISDELSIHRPHSSDNSTVHNFSTINSVQTDDLSPMSAPAQDLPLVAHPTTSQTNQEQNSDDKISDERSMHRLHRSDDLAVHNSSIEDYETAHLPQLLTSESNVTDKQNGIDTGLANAHHSLCQRGSDDIFCGNLETSDLSSTGLSLDTEDGASFPRVRKIRGRREQEMTNSSVPTIDASSAPPVSVRDAARSKNLKTSQASLWQDLRSSWSLRHRSVANSRVRADGGRLSGSVDLSSKYTEMVADDCYDAESGDDPVPKITKYKNDPTHRRRTKLKTEAGMRNAAQNPLTPIMSQLVRTDMRIRRDGFWHFRPTDLPEKKDLTPWYYTKLYVDAGVETRGEDPLVSDRVATLKQGTEPQAHSGETIHAGQQ